MESGVKVIVVGERYGKQELGLLVPVPTVESVVESKGIPYVKAAIEDASKTEKLQERNHTLGSQFLGRLTAEAMLGGKNVDNAMLEHALACDRKDYGISHGWAVPEDTSSEIFFEVPIPKPTLWQRVRCWWYRNVTSRRK